MSNNRLRAKTRWTICIVLTKKVVTSVMMKGRPDKGKSREIATLCFQEAKINKWMNKYRYTFKTLSHRGHCIHPSSRYCAERHWTQPSIIGSSWPQTTSWAEHCTFTFHFCMSVFCVTDTEKHSQQAVYWEMFKGKPPVGLCVILH